jgi:hypothetical protein
MNRCVLTILLAAVALGPSLAEARTHRRYAAPCYPAPVAAPQTAMVQPAATPVAANNNNQYQSFSYEPGAGASAAAPTTVPVIAPAPAVMYVPAPRYVPPYLRPAYKAHGTYEP